MGEAAKLKLGLCVVAGGGRCESEGFEPVSRSFPLLVDVDQVSTGASLFWAAAVPGGPRGRPRWRGRCGPIVLLCPRSRSRGAQIGVSWPGCAGAVGVVRHHFGGQQKG